MSRVAIFGGSFNPPHLGHQTLGLMVLEAAPVDELWLVPTYKHYFGKALVDFDHRVELCRLLVEPLGSRAKVLEIEREGPGRGRMLDTLEALVEAFPGNAYRLIIGADILLETDRWHAWNEVCRLAEPLVFQRHGYAGGDFPAPPDISSTEIRERLELGQSLLPLVPGRVAARIDEAGLYR